MNAQRYVTNDDQIFCDGGLEIVVDCPLLSTDRNVGSEAVDSEILALNQAIIDQAALWLGAVIRSNPVARQHLCALSTHSRRSTSCYLISASWSKAD